MKTRCYIKLHHRHQEAPEDWIITFPLYLANIKKDLFMDMREVGLRFFRQQKTHT